MRDETANISKSYIYIYINTVKRTTQRATQYAPVGYIPQALGLRIGMALRLNPYNAMQLARIFNFIACLGIYIASLMLIPHAKTLVAIIASIPTVCFVSSSVMADGLTIALPTLLTAMALRAIDTDAPMRTPTIASITIISAMICYIKVLYLVPLLIVLVLPHYILPLRRKIYMLSALTLVFISYMIWRHSFGSVAYLANYQDNLHYAIRHPLHIIFSVAINIAMGWNNLMPDNSYITVIAILLITMTSAPLFIDASRTKQSIITARSFISKNRYLFVVIFGALLAWTLTYGFIALTWNNLSNIGSHGYLEGVQGRHILPLLPLLTVTSVYSQEIE